MLVTEVKCLAYKRFPTGVEGGSSDPCKPADSFQLSSTTDPSCSLRCKAGYKTAYVILPLGCSSEALLATITECNNAKTLLDPTAGMQEEDEADAPKGCYRSRGMWYFNTHATGKIDGESEPVCKPAAGESSG